MADPTRNVIDYYKSWETDLIKGDLDSKRHNFSVVCYNLGLDFNIGQCCRLSNSFLCKAVYIYPRKRFDKRGCVGTQNYENLKHVKHLDDINDLPKDAVWIAIDNVPNAEPIETFTYPEDKHIVFCFGSEGLGLPPEMIARCQHTLFIKQYGSVRSLNVGTACAITLYDIMQKRGK
jgi:tRNA G18 (ribose-2'-O)-methylase SpoU